LILALDAEGFPVVAALWYYIADEERWRLIIASQIVADRGPRAGYFGIQKVLDSSGIPLDLRQVKVEEPDDPIIIDLRLFAGTAGVPYLGGTFLHRAVKGSTYIEKAYVYRAERIIEETGTKEVTALVRDKQAKVWRPYPSVLTSVSGRIEEVKVQDYEWPQSRTRNGLRIRLFVLANPSVKKGQTFGDVQRWIVVGGRLERIENWARGVRVEGVADTNATA